MAKRNLVWLVVIVVVGVVVWLAAGWVWGVVAAAVVLVTSEVFERARRRRLAQLSGRPAPSPLANVAKRRQR